VAVAPDAVLTVAAVGRYAETRLNVLTDDLTPPAAGQARVRVIHAAARNRTLDVVADTGPVFAESTAISENPAISMNMVFATTSRYASVPAGTWRLRVGPDGGRDGHAGAQVNCTVSAGGVYTVLLLDGRSGGLDVVTRADAQGARRVPVGVVNTGFDASTPDEPRGVLTDTLFGLGAAALGALALAAVVALRVRRRRRVVPTG
jgi:hypothetical protein